MLLLVALAVADPVPGLPSLVDPLTGATQEVFDGPAGLVDEPHRLNAEADPGALVGGSAAGAHLVGTIWREKWTLTAALTAEASGSREGSTTDSEGLEGEALYSRSSRDVGVGLAGSYAPSSTAYGASLFLRARRETATLGGDLLDPGLGSNTTARTDDFFLGNGGGVVDGLTTAEARFGVTGTLGGLRPSGGIGARFEQDAARIDYAQRAETTGAGGVVTESSTSLVGPDPFGLLDANPNLRRFELELRGALDHGGTLRDPSWRGAAGVRVGLVRPAEGELVWTEEVDGGLSEATLELADPGGAGLTAWLGGFRQLGDPPAGRVRLGAWALIRHDATRYELRQTDGFALEGSADQPFDVTGTGGDRGWSSLDARVLLPAASEVRPGPAWTLRAAVVPWFELRSTRAENEDGSASARTLDLGASTSLGLAWRSPGGVGASLVWSGGVSTAQADAVEAVAGLGLDSATLWVSWEPG